MKALLCPLLAASSLCAQTITPSVDAIERTGPGTYRFWMGYRSTFSAPVTLTSRLIGGFSNSPIPTNFAPGRYYAVFWVSGEAVWQVGSSTATASMGFQSSHSRDFLDQERPFSHGGVIAFDFRTITENGVTKHVFKWWRRDPATGKIPAGFAWENGAYDWQTNPAPGTVTYALVLTDTDRDLALSRLGLTASDENNRRALINEALRRVDKLTTTP